MLATMIPTAPKRLNFDPGAVRRSASKVEFSLLGPIERSDVDLLHVKGSSKADSVQKISARHHRLARHLAAGMKPGQAAALCGYSNSRVSILRADPLFRRLEGLYREQVEELFADQGAKLAEVSHTALDLLMTRMEEAPEELTVAQLQDLIKLGADRTGFGPSKTIEANVNHNLGAELEARWEAAQLRKREMLEEAGEVIEGEVIDG